MTFVNRCFLAAVVLELPVLATTARAETVPFHNVHLTVADPVQAAQWYIAHLGGTSVREFNTRVTFGKMLVVFVKGAGAAPSAGSAVDHLGFSFPDVTATMKTLESAGVKILQPVRDVPGLFKLGFIEDPWGIKIELVQDDQLLGFHHVHLRAPDPEASFAWYQNAFGGTREKLKGRVDGIRYGGIWLFVQGSNGEKVAPSADRAITSVGWAVSNMATAAAALKEKGATFTTEPRDIGRVWYAFVEGPAGVKVELVQDKR